MKECVRCYQKTINKANNIVLAILVCLIILSFILFELGIEAAAVFYCAFLFGIAITLCVRFIKQYCFKQKLIKNDCRECTQISDDLFVSKQCLIYTDTGTIVCKNEIVDIQFKEMGPVENRLIILIKRQHGQRFYRHTGRDVQEVKDNLTRWWNNQDVVSWEKKESNPILAKAKLANKNRVEKQLKPFDPLKFSICLCCCFVVVMIVCGILDAWFVI